MIQKVSLWRYYIFEWKCAKTPSTRRARALLFSQQFFAPSSERLYFFFRRREKRFQRYWIYARYSLDPACWTIYLGKSVIFRSTLIYVWFALSPFQNIYICAAKYTHTHMQTLACAREFASVHQHSPTSDDHVDVSHNTWACGAHVPLYIPRLSLIYAF